MTDDGAARSNEALIAEVERLHNAATPGPWAWYEGYDSLWQYMGAADPRPTPDYGSSGALRGPNGDEVVGGVWCNEDSTGVHASDADKAFIARARELLPLLASRLRAAETATKDSVRLDWLEENVATVRSRGVSDADDWCEVECWEYGPPNVAPKRMVYAGTNYRAAIDAAMSAAAALPDGAPNQEKADG